MEDKSAIYSQLLPQVSALTESAPSLTSLLANTASLLHGSLGFWWTGFYLVSGDELILGPFQGPIACTRISFGKGVCGSAWQQRKTLRVDDVEQFPGHIACSNASRSEIVIPLLDDKNHTWGVLDIDSDRLAAFDSIDENNLSAITDIISLFRCRHHSPVCHICLAGGCFWGLQHFFSLIPGVLSTQVGFANGNIANPTYEQVYTDQTGFAEAVAVTYDSNQISLAFLLQLFFKTIDPTSLNRQGEDCGTRYRTGIYYSSPDRDLPVILTQMRRLQSSLQAPSAIEVLPLSNFYPADDSHQEYLRKHPSGYCHIPLHLFDVARNACDPSMSD